MSTYTLTVPDGPAQHDLAAYLAKHPEVGVDLHPDPVPEAAASQYPDDPDGMPPHQRAALNRMLVQALTEVGTDSMIPEDVFWRRIEERLNE